MCAWSPPTLCKSHLIVFISSVCPSIICVLIYFQLIDFFYPISSNVLANYTHPSWSFYIGFVITCLPLTCIPLAAFHYLLIQSVPSFQYHFSQRALLNATKKDQFLSFLNKLQNSFRFTLTYRTNELRHNQRFKLIQSQTHPAIAQHTAHEPHLNSNYGLPIGTSVACCAMPTQSNVCLTSRLAACPINSYGNLCPCPIANTANVNDVNCRIERVRCECARFFGEYNQGLVQEF